MPEGVGRNKVSRESGLKLEVVSRNLKRLKKDGLVLRHVRGSGKISPYFIPPPLYLDHDLFEKKCRAMGLFNARYYGHGFLTVGRAYSQRTRLRRKGPTIGSALRTVERRLDFLVGYRDAAKEVGKASESRGFVEQSIIDSVLSQSHKQLIMLIAEWFGQILVDKGPMTGIELQLEARLGGKPLRGNLAISILALMKRLGYVYLDNDGLWHITKLGRSELHFGRMWGLLECLTNTIPRLSTVLHS